MERLLSVRGLRPFISLSDSLKIKELLNLIYAHDMALQMDGLGETKGVKHNAFAVYSKNDRLKGFEIRRVYSKSVIAYIDVLNSKVIYYKKKKVLTVRDADTLAMRELRHVCYD